MKSMCGVITVVLTMFMTGSTASAQDLVLKGRSVLEIDLRMWGGSRVSNTIGLSGIQTSANISSFVGSAVYSYRLREEMAVTLSVGMLSAGANVGVGLLGASQESGMIVPILIGARYYVPSPETGASVRPFLSLGVGTYIGFEESAPLGSRLCSRRTPSLRSAGGSEPVWTSTSETISSSW